MINKRKPPHLKGKILFINADREYGEGRNQNYLRPEDIEKIVTVFEEKKEIPKYSRLVDLKEIEENDFNLNIRRYVDNSPDPEIEDVHAHLVGGVPKREVEIYKKQMEKFRIGPEVLLKEKDDRYFEFKEVSEKNKIREIVENHSGVKGVISEHFERLSEWWEKVKKEIEGFHGGSNLWDFRNKAIADLKEKLLPLGVLDEFKIAGVFVNWWEALRYDFKTIISSGWSKRLIEDDRIKKKFFSQDLEEIEELEGRIAEVEGELNELLDEVEDRDEEEYGKKTASKVKKYLKQTAQDLRATLRESALREALRWESLIKKIEEKERELRKIKRDLRTKEQELEEKIKHKRESLTEGEAKELLLEKFYDLISQQLEKYLNAENKELIKIFEKLWDKYSVSLEQWKKERDEEVRKLGDFLVKLGYYGQK